MNCEYYNDGFCTYHGGRICRLPCAVLDMLEAIEDEWAELEMEEEDDE